MVNEFLYESMIGEIKEFFSMGFYGNLRPYALKKFKPLLFLGDPCFDDARKWIVNALHDFDENPVFKQIEGNVNPMEKCLYVKLYRQIANKRKKNKDETPITIEELTAAFINQENGAGE